MNSLIIIIQNYCDCKGNVYSTENEGKKDGFNQIEFFKDKTIIKIDAGLKHSLFLDQENILWSRGDDTEGQLGYFHDRNVKFSDLIPAQIPYFMNNKTKVINIDCGANHNLCVDSSGICYGFGYNVHGECGVGKTKSHIISPEPIDLDKKFKIIDVKCGSNHSYVKSGDSSHFLFGFDNENQCKLMKSSEEKSQEHHVISPYRINKIFDVLTKGKVIKEVFLGYRLTWIVARNNT